MIERTLFTQGRSRIRRQLLKLVVGKWLWTYEAPGAWLSTYNKEGACTHSPGKSAMRPGSTCVPSLRVRCACQPTPV